MIEFRNVHKVYEPGTHALNGVSLKIEDGEFVFLVGPSGSGKSTIIKILTAELMPTSGSVFVNGFTLEKIRRSAIPYMRRTLGVIFQDFRLIDNKTVYDNVSFAMRVIGASEKEIKKRVPYVLELVGLENKSRRLPHELSGGEQQRVAIARALVNNPNMIIAHWQPRPGAFSGDYDAAGANQRPGHYGNGGHPREGAGEPLHQAGHRH